MKTSQNAVLHDPALFTMDIGQLSVVVELAHEYTPDEVVGAVERLQRVFPILGCRYRHGFWRDRWEWADMPASRVVRVANSSQPEADRREAIHEPIDVLAGPPFRVTYLKTGGNSALVLNMPHQIVDGSGLLTTLHELAGQLTGTGRNGPVAMNRSFLQLFGAIRLRDWPRILAESLRDTVSFARMAAVTPWTAGFTPETGPAIVKVNRVRFSEPVSHAFHAACKARDATVNDGLVAQALRMVSQFSKGDRVGAAYTINLRKFLHSDAPIVGNMSGFLMLNLLRKQAQEADEALRFVKKTIGAHKKGFTGVGSNLTPLPFLGWLPHGLLRRAAGPVGQGFRFQGGRAAVMTNVGPMDAYLAPWGGLAVDAWMTPPSIPGFPSPISLATSFRDRLSMAVGGPANLSEKDVDAVARVWETGITEFSAGSALPLEG